MIWREWWWVNGLQTLMSALYFMRRVPHHYVCITKVVSACKMKHNQLTDEHRWQRQQANSTVLFDILSPESKKSKINMLRPSITGQVQCCENWTNVSEWWAKWWNSGTGQIYRQLRSQSALNVSRGWQRQGWYIEEYMGTRRFSLSIPETKWWVHSIRYSALYIHMHKWMYCYGTNIWTINWKRFTVLTFVYVNLFSCI